MKYKDAVEIGREEAFELSGCELPTSKVERLICRRVGLGDSVIYKEYGKYYIAPFDSTKELMEKLTGLNRNSFK